MHGQARLIYGIRLARNTERYLMGQDPEPEYIFPQKKADEASKQYKGAPPEPPGGALSVAMHPLTKGVTRCGIIPP